jgi:hypothetical protein
MRNRDNSAFSGKHAYPFSAPSVVRSRTYVTKAQLRAPPRQRARLGAGAVVVERNLRIGREAIQTIPATVSRVRCALFSLQAIAWARCLYAYGPEHASSHGCVARSFPGAAADRN